jgi:hypothetical protein
MIPHLANVAIANRNLTNPRVVRGLGFVPGSNLQRGTGNGEFT